MNAAAQRLDDLIRWVEVHRSSRVVRWVLAILCLVCAVPAGLYSWNTWTTNTSPNAYAREEFSNNDGCSEGFTWEGRYAKMTIEIPSFGDESTLPVGSPVFFETKLEGATQLLKVAEVYSVDGDTRVLAFQKGRIPKLDDSRLFELVAPAGEEDAKMNAALQTIFSRQRTKQITSELADLVVHFDGIARDAWKEFQPNLKTVPADMFRGRDIDNLFDELKNKFKSSLGNALQDDDIGRAIADELLYGPHEPSTDRLGIVNCLLRFFTISISEDFELSDGAYLLARQLYNRERNDHWLVIRRRGDGDPVRRGGNGRLKAIPMKIDKDALKNRFLNPLMKAIEREL